VRGYIAVASMRIGGQEWNSNMRLSLRNFLSKFSIAALIFGLSVAPVALEGQSTDAGAQQGGIPRQGFLLRSQTNVVLVDVRVTAKGKPVTDLTAKDFRVFEDGALQTITSFSLENVEKLAQANTTNGPPPTIDLDKLPPNVPPATVLQDHRLTLLFFDVSSMQPDDLMRATKVRAEKADAGGSRGGCHLHLEPAGGPELH
jgi:hypothetical protein